MKLGAYFWDGWYAKIPHWTDRLMRDFTCREPVWGWQGSTVENMELQINYAADAGLSFFAFDWYYPQNGKVSEMNNAVDRFLASSNHNRMKFCLLVANHEGGYIFRDKLEDACRRFMPYLTNDDALKVDGKPVIIFFLADSLIEKLGGEKECAKCLGYLKQQAKAAGLPGVYVMACVNPPRDSNGDLEKAPHNWEKFCRSAEEAGIDALTGYNYHRGKIVRNNEISYIFPYNDMAAEHCESWDRFSSASNLPYMPIVIGGWDCRPWETIWEGKTVPQPRSCYSPDRTPSDVYNHILDADKWLKENSEKAVEDLAIIYAWNENGEGGFIEPTFGDRGKTLEFVGKAIKDANAQIISEE